MIYQIKNRWISAVQWKGEIEATADTAEGVKRGLAVRAAVKAGASLADANLADADLAGVNLARADLADADLADAYLGQCRFVVSGGFDRRGHSFMTLVDGDSLLITAGCRRWSSFGEARAYYGDNYSSNGDRAECLARIALMEDQVEARAAETAP